MMLYNFKHLYLKKRDIGVFYISVSIQTGKWSDSGI